MKFAFELRSFFLSFFANHISIYSLQRFRFFQFLLQAKKITLKNEYSVDFIFNLLNKKTNYIKYIIKILYYFALHATILPLQ